METYSATYDQDSLLASLPKFLVIEREVTGDPAYSMYNLSLKEDWKTSKRYYAGRKDAGTECQGKLSMCFNILLVANLELFLRILLKLLMFKIHI